MMQRALSRVVGRGDVVVTVDESRRARTMTTSMLRWGMQTTPDHAAAFSSDLVYTDDGAILVENGVIIARFDKTPRLVSGNVTFPPRDPVSLVPASAP